MKAIENFRKNIACARELGKIFNALKSMTTSALPLDDILRSQLVMSVSALDHYIHEVVRQEMLNIFKGKRPVVPGFKKFEVPIYDAQSSMTGNSDDWLDAVIRRKHSHMSFQRPDKIANAIRLIHPDPLWPALGQRLSEPADNLKNHLKLIVDRRNKIAHESDVNPIFPGERWPITYDYATDATNFIEMLVEAIDNEVHGL